MTKDIFRLSVIIKFLYTIIVFQTSEMYIPDMIRTFKRLMMNPTLMCNNFAAIFYFMGYMPYWIFMPKYIETMYKQSASASSFITGTVSLTNCFIHTGLY